MYKLQIMPLIEEISSTDFEVTANETVEGGADRNDVVSDESIWLEEKSELQDASPEDGTLIFPSIF